MRTTTYKLTLGYRYDPNHKGAPYTIDGEHWFNHGDLCEIALKHCLGFKAVKDGNGKWNKCSDIEETATSVKSSKATLASDLTGTDIDLMLDRYFAEVHSTNFSYVAIVDESLIEYNMNAEEFREFTKTWANINERKVIRYKSTSGKMLRWLDERVA